MDAFVTEQMRTKMVELREETSKAIRVLREEKHSLWTVLRSSTLHKLDYWLGSVYPSLMLEAASEMDSLLSQMLEDVFRSGLPLDGEDTTVLDPGITGLQGKTYQWWLSQLPVKAGGLGLRNQVTLSKAAFLGHWSSACLSSVDQVGSAGAWAT